MTECRYFVTVDWCGQGQRGVFCDPTGRTFCRETPHSEDEMWDILGPFDLILSPQSVLISEEELTKYSSFVPLAEFSNQYGIAYKP